MKRGSSGARNAGSEPYSEYYSSQLIKAFTNNFGFLVDNSRQEIIAPDPLFDHNVGVLPYAEEENFKNVEDLMKQKSPRLSIEWLKTAAYCMTPECKKALINLYGFKFEQHPKYNWPEWRIEVIEQLINQNIETILSYL